MTKKNKYQDVSPQTKDEALKSAKATQRPGQTKEQTKLIAQGIEKGIAHYKKNQKEKSRELNKKINKVSKKLASADEGGLELPQSKVEYKNSVFPWVLLVLSWVVFCGYFLID